MRPAVGETLRRTGAQHDGGEQHLAAGHALHRDGRPAGQRLHYGRLDPRPRRDDPRAGRPRNETHRPGPPGTYQSPARARQGRAAPSGTHRGGHRPGPPGRIAARRRADRDYERGRHDGPPAATAGDRKKIRPKNHLDRLADRLPPPRGVDHRKGRDGAPAHGVGRIPDHTVPPEIQRRGACGPDERGVDRRRTGAGARAFVVRHRRTAATAASSSTRRWR